MSRFNDRKKAFNDEEMYKNLLDDRGVKKIIQYTTPVLKFPDEEELLRIQTVDYTWKQGDRFWRIASKHFGNPRLWWVVAQFNRKPTESHLTPGDVIKIPINLDVVLGALL
tara:strand:- start:2241 stop:2573 length:333 start_codon:yes stop_codon:yes gene_type:complete